MKSNKFNRIFIVLYAILLATWILKSSDSLMPIEIMKIIEIIIIILSFMYFIYSIMNNRALISNKLKQLQIIWLLFIVMYIIGFLHGYSDRRFIPLMQILLIFASFWSIIYNRWNIGDIRLFITIYICTIFAIVLYFSFVISLSTLSYLLNPNHLGILSMIVLYMSILDLNLVNKHSLSRWFMYFITVLSIIGIIISKSRSVYLGAFVGLVTYFVYSRNYYIKNSYSFLYISIIVIISLNTLICVKANYGNALGLENFLNQVNFLISDKRTFARDFIWEDAIKIIKKSPLTGIGIGWNTSSFTKEGSSTHSQYLQIGIQLGLPGIAIFLTLMYFIGRNMVSSVAKNKYSIIGVNLIFSIMIHQTFEVCLLESNLAYGIPIWLVLSICIVLSLKYM